MPRLQTDVTVDIVGHQDVIYLGSKMVETRTLLLERPHVEEFGLLIPYLAPGSWEVHVTLR